MSDPSAVPATIENTSAPEVITRESVLAKLKAGQSISVEEIKILENQTPPTSADQQPEARVDVNEEVLKKFQETSFEAIYGNGVDNVDVKNYELKRMTLATRQDLHARVENSVQKLLDERVTERLQAKIEEIQKVKNKNGLVEFKEDGWVFRKGVENAVKDLSNGDNLRKRMAELKNPRAEYGGKKLFNRKRDAAELTMLEELESERLKIEREEKAKLLYAHDASAEALKADFGWLGASVADIPEDKKELDEKLKGLLSPSEIAGWQKNEEMRMLLFHLKSEKYFTLLNVGNVDGVDTHIGLNKKAEQFSAQKAGLDGELKAESEKCKKAMEDARAFLTRKEGGEIKFPDDVSFSSVEDLQITISQVLEEQRLETRASESGIDDLRSELEMLEEKKKEKEKLEQERVALREKQSELAIKAAEAKNKSNATVININAAAETGSSQANNAVSDSGGAREIQLQMENLGQRIQTLDNKINLLENVGQEITNKKKEIQQKTRASEGAKKVEELGFRQKEKKLTAVLDSLGKIATTLEAQHELEKSTPAETSERQSSADLFTALETEFAKVALCKHYGFTDTAVLSQKENKHLLDEAVKLGKASVDLKRANFKTGEIQKENTALLGKIAERNPSMAKHVKSWRKSTWEYLKKPANETWLGKKAGAAREKTVAGGKILGGGLKKVLFAFSPKAGGHASHH